MRAAMNGPPATKRTASNGKNPQEIKKVKTKNVMSGWRLIAATVALLSPALEQWDISLCHDSTFRLPVHLPIKAYSLKYLEVDFPELHRDKVLGSPQIQYRREVKG
jgi:hypothetical protein